MVVLVIQSTQHGCVRKQSNAYLVAQKAPMSVFWR